VTDSTLAEHVQHATPLPRSTPQEQGLAPAAVHSLLDALESAGQELHSLMIVRHGHVVAEGWWEPYRPEGLHLLYSLSKSFTSTAVGLAVEEGLLGVDDLVTSFFPDELPAEVSPAVAGLKVRHLLSMATGHREDTLDRLDRGHLVSSFLALVPEEEPGSWFTYNNGATMMLSAIITRLTGGRLLDYLRPRLLEPLGITEANWQGIGQLDLGFSGLHLRTEAIAKLGQLYLQRGVWQGRQLVPQEWVAEATRVQVDNPREPNPDWRQGYGYQFWMGSHGYRGDGACGQFCVVLPEVDAVVAITAATDDMQAILDCIWAELWPALAAEAVGDPAGADLSDRLGTLALPLVPGERDTAAVSLPWDAATAEHPAGSQPAHVAITGITRVEEGWQVTVHDERATFAVVCGHQGWVTTDVEVGPGRLLRVAACGAWTAPDTFTAELAMVQTPHRMRVSVDCASGSSSAAWHVAPLGPTSPSQLALDLSRG
jgi:CubicO group peptidase (beta-lactamase class C family)